MNANELADVIDKLADAAELQTSESYANWHRNVATMLRQQQAEITSLKEYSRAKDRFPNYESICFQCGATIYKPYKELTDEEILAEWDWDSGEILAVDLLDFADAILRKAQEKC